jgi:hypothetical protein
VAKKVEDSIQCLHQLFAVEHLMKNQVLFERYPELHDSPSVTPIASVGYSFVRQKQPACTNHDSFISSC